MNDFRHARIGIAVFVFKNGKFLMGQRKGKHGRDTWSVPGGHLEFGESPEETSAREVREESGVEITNIRFGATTNDLFPDSGRHYVSLWMIADWRSGEPLIREPDKFIQMGWYDFESLPQPLFQPCWDNLRASPFYADLRRQMAATTKGIIEQ